MNDYELEQLIKQVEQHEMIRAPKRLKENILAESKSLSMQMEVTGRRFSSKVQLFIYGTKVTLAIIAAILLMGVINDQTAMTLNDRIEEGQQKVMREEDRNGNLLVEKVDGISGKIDSFMNGLSHGILLSNQ